MRKKLFILMIIAFIALICEFHGFHRGFEQGRKTTNAWWIDKKSRLYDTSEVLRKEFQNGHNQL